MNYHKNSYTGSLRKKVLIRVLTVTAALTVVSAATFAYGNYLKAKAESTLLHGTGAGRDPQTSGAGRKDSEDNSQIVKVKSQCVPIASLADGEKAAEYVNTLAANGNTGVSAVLVDREGYLTYPSERVAKFTHQKPSAGDLTVIRTTVARAKERSMRTSALLFAGSGFAEGAFSAEIDALVAADAAELGFDELVVVLPIATDQLGSELAGKVVGYLNTLAAKAETCSLGVCLSYDVFSTPQLSPHLELISSSSDFLAVDFTAGVSGTEAAAKYVTDAVEAISGSFSLYSLRAVFEGADADIAAAQVKALTDKGFENYMFVSATPIKPPDDTDDTQTGDNGQNNQGGTPLPTPTGNGGGTSDVPSTPSDTNAPEPPAGDPTPDSGVTPPSASPATPEPTTPEPTTPAQPTPAQPEPAPSVPDNDPPPPDTQSPAPDPGVDPPGTSPAADPDAPDGGN